MSKWRILSCDGMHGLLGSEHENMAHSRRKESFCPLGVTIKDQMKRTRGVVLLRGDARLTPGRPGLTAYRARRLQVKWMVCGGSCGVSITTW